MIAEFGIEPEVLAQWRHFQALWGDFGIAPRRQIGLYPKKWKQVTIDRARALIRDGINTEIQVAKMVERMSGDGSKAKFRKTDCSDWQERPWIENAVGHQPAFDTIITANASSASGVLVAGEFLRDEPPYAREPSMFIARSVPTLIRTAWPILARAREIVLVDPNFDPIEPRFLDPLIHLLDELKSAGVHPTRFELHTCKFRRVNGELISRVRPGNYNARISPHLPAGWTLEVCFWGEMLPQYHLHPRFILSDIGGIYYDVGLDAGEVGSTTLVTALGDKIYVALFDRYKSSGADFAADKENQQFKVM